MKKGMKKAMASLVVLSFMMAMVGPAFAAPDKSKTDHIYLYEKDTTTWDVIDDGAWGKLSYKTDTFVFNGHSLPADTDYSLVRYLDPWETHVVTVLAEGTTNNGGNIHLAGAMLDGGPKVWLVLTDDLSDDKTSFAAWNDEAYLFENNLI